MFHVKPAAALLLGVLVSSAAVFAQADRVVPSPEALDEPKQPADAGVADGGPSEPTSGAAPAPGETTGQKKRKPSATKATGSAAKASSSATLEKKGGSGGAKKGATAKPTKKDPRTVGLGRGCTRRADCASKSQICLRQVDQRGKALGKGFCALPCARIEQGLTPTRPGFPARDAQTTEKILKKPPPSRCPPRFKCRSKGGDVSIDLCVRE
jgi:hypothetical protein